MSVVILVASHEPYKISQDIIYKPILVGAEGQANDAISLETAAWLKDNTHCHISNKNPYYCELTALYWAWKNVHAEYIGLFHYRRYFRTDRLTNDKWKKIMRGEEIYALLKEHDVLLPAPRHYFIETNYTQYVHAHNGRELELVREILWEAFPDYLEDFDRYMKRTIGHRFNILVMRRDILASYCEWLFDILFVLEERLEENGELRPRIIGHVAERLLDVWILHNNICYCDVPVVFLEKENWLKKGADFLFRKMKSVQETGGANDREGCGGGSYI